MASESRLYTFSQETDKHLRSFRLKTSRAGTLQAQIFHILKGTLEIVPSDASHTYTDLLDLCDDLPDNSPRFILLSYPITLQDGRKSVPYVMLFYMPETCSQDMRMVYAGAKDLFATKAEVGKVLDVESEEDVQGVEKLLGGV